MVRNLRRVLGAGGLASLLVAAAGCGGSAERISTGFEALTLVQEGGYGPASPAGAPCEIQGPQTLRVDATSRTLAWDLCLADLNSIHAIPSSGSRALSDSEFTNVAGTLSHVAISHAMTCGADEAVVTLDVRTPAGLALYADDFYSSCPQPGEEGRTFVTNVTDLDLLLFGLATH